MAYRLELPSDLDRIHDVFPCFYAPQVHTRPFTCIDRATSGNTRELDIRRGTSADPRLLRASSAQQDYSAGEGIVEESYSRRSYLGARGSDAPSVPSIIFRMRYFPSLSFGV